MSHLVTVEALDVFLTVDAVALVVYDLIELILLDLILLAVGALVAFLAAVVAHRLSLIVNLFLVWFRPVLRVGEICQLLQGRYLVNDDRLEVAFLAVRAVRTETGHVVRAKLLAVR